MDWYKIKLDEEFESDCDVVLSINRTPDPFDVIKCTIKINDVPFEMVFEWGYSSGMEKSLGVDYISQNVLVDCGLGNREYEKLNWLSLFYRKNNEYVYKLEWSFGNYVEIWTSTLPKVKTIVENVGEVIDMERVDFGSSLIQLYGHVGPSMKKLDSQLDKLRASNNVGNNTQNAKYKNGIIHKENDSMTSITRRKLYVANTSSWKWANAMEFLGKLREHNSFSVESAISPFGYVGAAAPSWVDINGKSGVGVVDLLPKYTPVDFPSVGVAEYVKLDNRYPNFMQVINNMSSNPAISIIVLLHSMMEYPEGLDIPKSSVHEKQFRSLFSACVSETFRKPILVMVRMPGVASMLQKAGCHVSPSVEACMDDLNVILERFMCTGLVQHKKAHIEELS